MAKPSLKCRICLEVKPRDNLESVTKPWTENSPRTIKELIVFCVPSVSIQDNCFLCTTCLWHLKLAYSFIERCLKTESLLVEGTSALIQKLPLQTNNGCDKLEKIFEKSIEDGNQIKIIFENPVRSKNFKTAIHDHTYVRHTPKKVRDRSSKTQKNDDESSKTPSENDTLSKTQENEAPSEATSQPNNEIPQEDHLDDNNDDDWFSQAGADDFGDYIDKPDKPTEESSEAPSKGSSKITINPKHVEKYPKELVDMLDFAPINVRCITVEKDMTPDHQQGLMEEGINVLNMSTDSNKKKRVMYLVRDMDHAFNECQKCKLRFYSRCDYLDHKRRHKKKIIRLPGSRIYSCDLCSKNFPTDRDLKKHCRTSHGESRPHQCLKCSKRFKSTTELKKHEDIFKDSERCVVTCPNCPREFTSTTMMEHHLAVVADAPSCDYQECKVCSVKFTKEDFKAHCQVHPNYVCEECGKSLTSNVSLSTHRKNVHRAVAGMCHECGKVIKNPKMLQHHLDTIHGNSSYMCDKCPRVFKSMVYLRKHSRIVHAEKTSKNFTCETCGKGFYTKNGVDQHNELMHLVPEKYKCHTCGETFPRKDYFQRHLAHHEKYMQFSCSVCRKSFASASRLLGHELAGHDENGKSLEHGRKIRTVPRSGPKKKYASPSTLPCICNICNRVLGGVTALRLHYKAHLNIREFWCEKCEITLQTYMAFKNHMRRHDDPNFELSCNICHAYKSSRVELEIHKREVHKNLKYKCKYCSAKFGRKHLLFSHESIKHREEYAKKENLYKMLAYQTAVHASGNLQPGKKGRKLIDTDIDHILNKLGKSDEELSNFSDIKPAVVTRFVTEENFDILDEDYQMTEEENACKVLAESMMDDG